MFIDFIMIIEFVIWDFRIILSSLSYTNIFLLVETNDQRIVVESSNELIDKLL